MRERVSRLVASDGVRVAAAALGLAVVVLVGMAGLADVRSAGDRPRGVVALELAGPDAGPALLGSYDAGQVGTAVWWDLLLVVGYVLALAAAAVLLGAGYRTLTMRRLALPMAGLAVGAGVLDLVEDLALAVVTHGWGVAGWHPRGSAWGLASSAAWGKWVVLLLVAAYVLGGLLSLLLPRKVREVLRTAEADTAVPSRTTGVADYGMAFSGGGIRAASITLGALQLLERDGGMGWGSADHVTSVSGGSYMTGAWNLTRTPGPEAPPVVDANVPQPWAWSDLRPGPEERHLIANLGYLLANNPRGTGGDSLARQAEANETRRAQRRPAVIATVLTGMLVNAFTLGLVLLAVSLPLGWFYRWYVGLRPGCEAWAGTGALTASSSGCLEPGSGQLVPVLAWLGVGLAGVLLWVLAAKADEGRGKGSVPPAWLLGPKYLGYGGLGLAGALALVLLVVPWVMSLVWRPVDSSAWTDLVAIGGALGSVGTVLRTMRRPLAKVAPVLGGVLFAALLGYLVCRWSLAGAAAGASGWWVAGWLAALGYLAVVHLGGLVELWSLSAFYRGKLRAAFATYRHVETVSGPDGREREQVVVDAYANGDKVGDEAGSRRVEPDLDSLPVRTAAQDGTPLTICAAATISGRDTRTHYGIPALSVTFSPSEVRLFAPRTDDGVYLRYSCPTETMNAVMPRWKSGPRLTTMMAVGMSGAAVSPAMGRFRVGPVSMLLAFANVRLGMWIPNPRFAASVASVLGPGRRLPRPGLGYLLKEFLGFHDPSDLYLYVTDGGHWENTALVELLRTSHHEEMVCVDADSGAGNLAGSISKAIDLAELECAATVMMNLDALRADPAPTPGRDYSPRSVTLGLVRRRDNPDPRLGEQVSILWYCKPALTRDMPPKLLAYREIDPTFPRTNTVNQFFHVAQFAAYRDLGRYNASMILEAREELRDAVEPRPDYAAFKAWVFPPTPRHDPDAPQDPEEPPIGWVFPELVSLVDQLAAQQPARAREAYAQDVYDTVRRTLVTARTPA